MNPLESLLGPVAAFLNRNLRAVTPARELCAELAGKVIAVRVRNTGLAMYFTIHDDAVSLSTDSDREPDAVVTGSLLTLARLAGAGGAGSFNQDSLELTGDAETALSFQRLVAYAQPDIEEELSSIVGDIAAHRIGEFARGLRNWAGDAGSTMSANVREFLQEESRDLPSRYEIERFASDVDALRDDVERLEARLKRLESDGP